MAVQTTEEYKNGGATSYAITIEYLQTSDVKVRIDGVLQTYTTGTPGSGEYSVSGTTVTLGAQAAAGSGNVHIYRETDVNTAAAVFAAGSSIRAADLNAIHDMARFSSVEHRNQVISANIKDGQVTTAKIAADNITSALIADDQINSEHYVADSIDSEHYAPGSVDSAAIGASQVTTNELATDSVNTTKIIDLNVTRAKLEADVIDSTKLADNAVNSEHYIDGSIDHVHLANDCIDGDNIQDDVVNSEHVAAGALDNEHYAAGSITSDKLNGATVITASEQGAATTNDTSFLTSAAADARFFNINTGETIKDGQTFPDNDTTIATTAAINDRIIDLVDDVGGFVPIANETSFPTANPDVNNGAGTIVSIAALASAITTGSGVTTKTIANGAGSGNTVTITGLTASTTYPAGMGMLVETTSTLHTYSFHRLVPKATEVSTVAGISGNVTTVAGIASNVTTVAGISSNVTTVAGNTTNINAVAGNATNINAVAADASDIGVVAADGTDIGLVAGSITNINNVGGSIASVNTAASNLTSINKFGDTYQIASSNPSTDGGGNSLAEGDLYFNTTANELKVYNGGAWQGGVTASGNFASTTGNSFSGDNTYVDNAKARFGTGQDLEIFHNANDSIINDTGTGTLKLQTGGNTKLEIQSGGVGVTGNITVSGNVDGRNLAVDGTKLDGGIMLADGDKGDITVSNTGAAFTIDNGVVTSAKIADGTIVNADISASAAIDASKIANLTTDAITEGNSRAEVIGSGTDNGEFKVGLQDNTYTGANKTALRLYQPSSSYNKLELFEENAENNGTLSIKHIYSGNGTSNLNFTTNDAGRYASIKYWGNLQAIKTYIAGIEKFDIGSNGCHVADKLYCNGGLDTDGDLQFNTGTTNSNVLFDASEGALKFTDNNKAVFGTGDDLQIFHNGTRSKIQNLTGELRINSNTIELKNYDDDGTYLSCVDNGAVELYHANSKKLETTSGGAAIDGNLTFGDNQKAVFGAGSDMSMFHNTNNYLTYTGADFLITGDASNEVHIRPKSDENAAVFKPQGAVELYHANTKRLETTSAGATITGGLEISGELDLMGTQYHKFIDADIGTYAFSIRGCNGTNANHVTMMKAYRAGAVELNHNGSKKLETISGGISVTGGINTSAASTFNQSTFNSGAGAITVSGGSDIRMSGGSWTGEHTGIKIQPDAGSSYFQYQGNLYFRNTSGNDRITIDQSGNFTAVGNVTAYSDARLKTDISTINDALGICGKLRGVSYKWIADGKPSIGVIAQEVEEVIPEVVLTNVNTDPSTGETTEVKSVDYGKIVGVLINAINELKAEVDELKGGK